MQDESRLAYQSALEVAKQLITLSTAIITLCIALTRDVFKRAPSAVAKGILSLALICYLLSIWNGIGHIQGLTGSLEWSAVEQVAAGNQAGPRKESAAGVYLRAESDSAVNAAREYLSRAGVFIGDSAKVDAVRQIKWFFRGTVLVVAFILVLMFSRAKGAAAEGMANPT